MAPLPGTARFHHLPGTQGLRSADPARHDRTRRRRTRPGHRPAADYLGWAQAVSLGRQGRPDDARAAFAVADDLMTTPAPMPHFRYLARRHVAEAIIDGSGDPRVGCARTKPTSTRTGTGESVPRRTRGPLVPAALADHRITGREMEVLQLLARGLTNQDIARRLVLSVCTIDILVEHLLSKTGTARRTHLVARAAGVSGERPRGQTATPSCIARRPIWPLGGVCGNRGGPS